MYIPRDTLKRYQYFQREYGKLWNSFKDELSDLERATLELKYGLSGLTLTGSEIAKHLELENKTYPEMIARRAIHKLRKAAVKAEKRK